MPSSGKSTMINALVGKRVLQSGVCRTTTSVTVVGHAPSVATTAATAPTRFVDESPVSTDGIKFCAVDLPGVCDTEDECAEFDGLTLEWARKCDVVVWVTDARTALSTTHERRAFVRLECSLEEAAANLRREGREDREHRAANKDGN